MIAENNLKRHVASKGRHKNEKAPRDSQSKIKEMQEREFRQRQKREHDIEIERAHDIRN